MFGLNTNKYKNPGKWRFMSLMFLLLWGLTALGADEQTPDKEVQDQCVSTIISEIGKLENNRDPKCHATATRLENFMYGTPLAADTRFLKVKLQKELLFHIWKSASDTAAAGHEEKTGSYLPYLQQEMGKVLKYSRRPNEDIVMEMNAPHQPITLSKRDLDHYSSVAYGLRAILALQQEVMLRADLRLIPLDSADVSILKEFVD